MLFSEARREEIVRHCQSLIQIPSYSGEEGKVVDFIEHLMREYGFDEIHRDHLGNIVGGIVGLHPGKTLVLDSHVDTVPVDREKWQHDPFGATIQDGKIYGRGTSDMKGAVAAMISAIAFFAQDNRRNFAGKIYVACLVHEECFEGIAARQVTERYQPDYVVIGEASQLTLKIGQRGRAEVVVETFGQPAHSATPEAGVNAVYHMTRVIDRIRTLPTTQHPILGQGILELTDIKSSPYPGASVVPDYCRVTYDRRLLIDESKESVLQPLQAVLEGLSAEDPQFRGQVSFAVGKERCYTGEYIEGERFFPGWLYTQEDEFVQKALKGMQFAGIAPKITHYAFCTNGSHYAGEAGIQTIGFGPSRENLAHTIDEYIEIEQLVQATAGYYGMIREVALG